MIEAFNVYSFTDPIEYLNFEFRERQRKNSQFSLRAWARQLGYENPSYLSHVLKRERKLKLDLANKISANLQLKGKEKKYFELIVANQSSESDLEKKVLSKMIQKLRPNQGLNLDDFPIEKFEMASGWYNWAILEFFYLKDFVFCVDEIFDRLGERIPKKKIVESISSLVKLGFVNVNEDGSYSRATNNALFMKIFSSQEARIRYYTAMMEEAVSALNELPPDILNLRGTMMALKKEKFQRAVEIISDAHKKILALEDDATENDGDDVYYFGSHFFPVTRTSKKRLMH